MTDIDKDQIVNEEVAAARNRPIRWSLILAGLLTVALVAFAVHDYAEEADDAKVERDVAENAVARNEPVIAELWAECQAGRPQNLPPGLTCGEVREADEAIEDVGEVQEDELQEPEIQDDEIQQPEIDNPDPDDPDRPNDPDPDDPETQDDEEQESEVNDAEPDDPEVQDEEFDDPENQEPEIQDEEIQESENQEPEIQEREEQDPQDPASSMTFHDLPAQGQTTTCDLIEGSGPNTPEYDCSTDPAEEPASSLLSWWGALAYLNLGRRSPGVTT